MSRLLSRVGRATATVLGAGLVPVAPGTVGSLVSAAVFYAIGPGSTAVWLLTPPVVMLGYWGCTEGYRTWGSDPSKVVSDEFAGCWIACLASPASWGLTGIAAAFLLFRIFDILKPWPVSFFDREDSPFGILMDDVAAGVLTGALLFAGDLIHAAL